MKKLCILLLFLLSGFCLSGQTNENWYVGEWTCVVEGNSVFITKDKRLIAPDYYRGSRKMYEADEIGTTTFYRVPWDDDTPEEELTEENTISVGLDRADLILTLSTEEASMDYYLERNSSTNGSSQANSNQLSPGHDDEWKSAFERNNGYLVFKSDSAYKPGYETKNVYRPCYFVLKGYGRTFKHGIVKYVFYDSVEEMGLYEMDDDVLLFFDMRRSTPPRAIREGLPRTEFAINGQVFNLDFESGISFSGVIKENKITFNAVYGSECPSRYDYFPNY